MPYFIGYALYEAIKWLIERMGKKVAYFTLYSTMFFALAVGFFSAINSALGMVSSNIGLGFSELNAMLPSGVTTVMSFYFSSKAVMWAFLAQYKYMNMKSILFK
ncbi:DUF5455 family protein [Photobacterium ganghwense]|uniref:DUF5455 family protein n=1 Tax=Photobacterium ganghwense TaxID=320778 RepID=UPI001A8D82C8|nr:DUF5455 family protein [Photobacterium ganghwense]QSV17309.1 DUF5455 family protein [Photobacterium ganghwense]